MSVVLCKRSFACCFPSAIVYVSVGFGRVTSSVEFDFSWVFAASVPVCMQGVLLRRRRFAWFL